MGNTSEPISFGKYTGLAEEVIAFAKDGGLLQGNEPATLPWDVIRNLEEAKRIAWDTPIGDQELLWTDLRELQMAEVRRNTYGQAEFTVIKDSLSGNLRTLTTLVRRRLDDLQHERLDDVVGDFYNCAFNRAINRANGSFEQLFDAYSAGGWPCGWTDNFPNGRLIVYFR